MEWVDASKGVEVVELPRIERDGGHREVIGAFGRIGVAVACPATSVVATSQR